MSGGSGPIRARAAWLMRLLVGAGLVGAGCLKARDPAAFSLAIERYRLVGETLAYAAGHYLPWVEIVAGGALVSGRGRRGAWRVALMLAVVFLGAVASAWARGLDIDCGCFGAGQAIDGWTVARNGALLGLVLVGGWLDRWGAK